MGRGDLDIVALGQRHFLNSLAVPLPIHKLPVELFDYIFIECAVQPPGTDPKKLIGRRPYSPDWISITHVCRRWRQIALNCPRLWTHITANLSAACIATFASRSSPKPMIVEISATYIINGTFQKHLSTNPSRLRELYLGYGVDDNGNDRIYESTQNLATILTTPAPFLETLVLEFEWVCLEEGLCAGYTPQLHRLSLRNCGFVPPTSSLLSNLRNLSLEHVEDFHNIYKVLQRTPLLEVLHMCYFHKMKEPNDSVIRLPHLSHFYFYPNSLAAATTLFESLEIPPTAHLKISLLDDTESDPRDEWSRMVDIISGHLWSNVRETSAPLVQLDLDILYHSWTVKCRPSSGLPPQLPTSQHLLEEIDDAWHEQKCDSRCESPFLFHFSYGDRTFRFDDDDEYVMLPMYHIRWLCSRMPLANIRALSLSIDLPCGFRSARYPHICDRVCCDTDAWLPILRLMPEVCVLKLSREAVIVVLEALTPDMNANNSLETPLFVHLKALVIEEAYVGCPHPAVHHELGQILLKTLTIFVSKRKEAGLELESILLRDCECIEGIVDLLGEYVKDVSWVGRSVHPLPEFTYYDPHD